MTPLPDRAVAAARQLPPEARDDIARLEEPFLADERAEPVPLAAQGEFAAAKEVAAVLAKHGL